LGESGFARARLGDFSGKIETLLFGVSIETMRRIMARVVTHRDEGVWVETARRIAARITTRRAAIMMTEKTVGVTVTIQTHVARTVEPE